MSWKSVDWCLVSESQVRGLRTHGYGESRHRLRPRHHPKARRRSAHRAFAADSSSESADGWVRCVLPYGSTIGFVLMDGKALGLGRLLERVERGAVPAANAPAADTSAANAPGAACDEHRPAAAAASPAGVAPHELHTSGADARPAAGATHRAGQSAAQLCSRICHSSSSSSLDD